MDILGGIEENYHGQIIFF